MRSSRCLRTPAKGAAATWLYTVLRNRSLKPITGDREIRTYVSVLLVSVMLAVGVRVAVQVLPPSLLRQMTDVDQIAHVAIVAEVLAERA